jgi:molecular chaperone GrpE
MSRGVERVLLPNLRLFVPWAVVILVVPKIAALRRLPSMDPVNEEASTPPESSTPPSATGSDAPGSDTAVGDTAAPNAALAAVTEERDKLKEQLLRTAADFDNFRKRARRELDDAKSKSKEDTLRDMLPVFDNLERAVQAAQTATDVSTVTEGVRMVLKLFEDTAERQGLTRVKSVGERFDPAQHEAIQQVETDAHAPGTIIAEIAPGYQAGTRLLRAAMVVVARKAAAKAADAAAEPKTENLTGGNEGAA